MGALVALNGALTAAPSQPASLMPGESRRFAWDLGSVHYTVQGRGSPIVLVHGLGVAASSFEYRYVVETLARAHGVFALDLLGFGLSDHPAIAFTGSMYVKLLADFLKHEVELPAVLVGTGQAALYCTAVAAQHPERVSAAVLNSPDDPAGRPELPPVMRQTVAAVLSAPIAGQSLFLALTARNALRSSLRERAYSNPDLVTESMVDAQYAMAHQRNARIAPRAYLAGHLQYGATRALALVRQPLLLVVGGNVVPSPLPRVAEYVRLAAQAQVRIIDRCGTLPHEEQPEQYTQAMLSWLSASAGPA